MNASIRTKAVAAGRRTAALSCAITAALGWAQMAGAQVAPPDNSFELGLEGGVEYTDNVSRSRVNEESETIGIAAVTFGVNTDRPRLDANAAAHLEYRKYLDDTYDDEIVGGLDALMSYAFIPERFMWVVQDNFGQVASDLTEADTPDNRENFNYLSTGPDVIFPLTGRMTLQFSGRYLDTYYEERDEDSQGISGSLALIRQMSDTSNLSLNGSVTEIEYDEDAFIDYRIDRAFLRWATLTERTTFTLDGGYNRIEVDNGDTSGGLLGRLEFSRAVGARSRFGIVAGTAFETPGEAIRRDQALTGIELGADDSVAAADAYQVDYAYVTWNTDWPRGGLVVGLNASSEDHEVEEDANRDVYGASVRAMRQLSRRLEVNLTARYSEEDLSTINFKFDEFLVGVGLRWQASERFDLRFEIDHIEGSSDDGSRTYDENRAYVGFTYSRTR